MLVRLGAASSLRWFAWLAPPLFVLLVVGFELGAGGDQFRVPLSYSGDGLFYLGQTKATIDHGWWWSNPSIGAPFGYHALTFPQNANVDQGILWLIARFTQDLGVVQNAGWMAMIAFGAAIGRWCFRRLGVSQVGAAGAAIVFALSPFVFYRNVTHFALATYLVPFPAAAAVLLAGAPRDRLGPITRWGGLLAGCFLIGLNYIYFAFFGAMLLAAGAFVGALRSRSSAPLQAGGALLGAVVLATALNLAPTFHAWQLYGHPSDTAHLAAESEIYGLKLRHLVTPVAGHGVPPITWWLRRDGDIDFPLENENYAARLGFVACGGFLGLMTMLIFPLGRVREHDNSITQAAAALALATFLVGTIGGFGSLFSLLVSSDIRGYNRISPYIGFFSLVAAAVWVDRIRSARWRLGVWVAFVALTVIDLHPIVSGLVRQRPENEAILNRVERFVADLESRLPADAMVFQLPMRPFPADSKEGELETYENLRPYLASRTLRWSYPAMSRQAQAWQQQLGRLEPRDLPQTLRDAGFSAIVINRNGYPDRGEAIAQAISSGATAASPFGQTSDFIVLDLGVRTSSGQTP
jgi:phosphoglycerol transferase